MDEDFNACTFCGGERLLLGPRGGACVNVFCIECGAKFNVLLYPLFPMTLVDTLSPPNALRAELFKRMETWAEAMRTGGGSVDG